MGVIYTIGLILYFWDRRITIDSILVMTSVFAALCTERVVFDLVVACFILYGYKGSVKNENTLDYKYCYPISLRASE